MGKRIDFDINGGYPMSQDTLKLLQAASHETIDALAKIAGGDCVLWGAAVRHTSGDLYDIDEGWIYYGGKLHYVPEATGVVVPDVDGANPITYLIDEAATTLTYYDGEDNEAEFDTTVTLVAWPIGTDDDTHVGVAGMPSYIERLGSAARNYGGWTPMAVSTGSGNGNVTGSINYIKDALSNELLLRGSLTAASPGDFTSITLPISTDTILMGTLPQSHWPNFEGYFSAQVLNSGGSMPQEDYANTFLYTLQGIVKTNGEIRIKWIEDTNPYGCRFNLRLNLD